MRFFLYSALVLAVFVPVSQAQTVYMVSGDNCQPCQRWKLQERPFVNATVSVVETVPTFFVVVGDRVRRLTGYQPARAINTAIRELRLQRVASRSLLRVGDVMPDGSVVTSVAPIPTPDPNTD